jgi:hypothetical protein
MASFIDSEEDIDLDTIGWKTKYWDDLPTSDEDITDNMTLMLLPEPSALYYNEGNPYTINYAGDDVYETTINPDGTTTTTIKYKHNHMYRCDATGEEPSVVFSWTDIGSFEPVLINTIKIILESMDMYMALIGLRSKHEFNLYISNQISKLTPIVSEPSNGDSNAVPSNPNDYEYVPPYYDVLNEVHLLHLYLQFYFIDNRSAIDKQDRKSQLAKVVDDYYLEDHLHFISDYKYGSIENLNADTSRSYMNETMYSVRNGTSSVKLFDYIKTNIRDILDQDDSIQNTHEIEIGIGKTATEFDNLRESYASITDLYKAFIEVTWNAKDPRTFYAVRRLRKMLMTTRYANEIYALKGTENDPQVASSYKELLDSIDPILSTRIDNMSESQRIDELEYSLDCLSKCADDLVYLHAYGGFNMKKIISYIFKLLIFFKSAKADLLDYALEFHIDDKTDNMIKYMSELTKISTDTTISPDKWRITDYLASRNVLIRLNSDKSDKIRFFDTDRIILLAKYVNSHSLLGLMDQIALHMRNTVMTTDLNYNLYDHLRHYSDTITINPRHDVERVFARYKYIVNERAKAAQSGESSRYTQYDEDLAYLAYKDALNIFNDSTLSDRHMTFGDTVALTKRVIYKLDYDAEPTIDEYGNTIYPKLLDEYGLPVREITTDFIDFNDKGEI